MTKAKELIPELMIDGMDTADIADLVALDGVREAGENETVSIFDMRMNDEERLMSKLFMSALNSGLDM